MTAYVDTSVLLRIALAEGDALRQWRSIESAWSSELARIESLRSLDRARIVLSLSDDAVAARREAVLRLFGGLRIVRIDPLILARSAEAFPTVLGTLDAIHLATALAVREEQPDLVFATHDRALAVAARAVGFRVIGAPR